MATEPMIPMSVSQLARTMANAVSRERARCQRMIVELAEQAAAKEQDDASDWLLHAASVIGRDAAPRVVELSAPATFDTSPEAADEEELPPVRHGDDFADGVALLRTTHLRG